MSQTANQNFPLGPSGTEGLDDLFQGEIQGQCQMDQNQVQVDLPEIQIQDYVEPNQIHVELVALSEAAKRLGVSRRYAQKMIAIGKLAAVRDPKGHWLVKMDRGQIQIQDHVESKEAKDQVQVEQAQDHVDPFQVHVEPNQVRVELIDAYQIQIEQLQEKLDATQLKLEAASFRNGYLEAQLEASHTQMKLLTDNQHKPNWWQRFCSWFLGQK